MDRRLEVVCGREAHPGGSTGRPWQPERSPLVHAVVPFPVTSERTSEHAMRLGLDGGHAWLAVFGLVRLPGATMPRCTLRTIAGERLRPFRRSKDLVEYRIPASGEISLQWQGRAPAKGD